MLKYFKDFALKGNIVDMAVGVIIGGAFGKIVTSLVNDIIMPCISIMTSGVDFTQLKVVLKPEVLSEAGEVVTSGIFLNYGMFIQNIVDFLIIAFSIFITLRILFKRRDDKLKKEAEEKARPAAEATKPETELDVLSEIRAILKENAKTQE